MICSCKVETTIEVFDQIVDSNSFKVCAIHYGGFAGQGTTNYEFRKMRDSVQVIITEKWIFPNEKYKIKLTKSEYELVVNNLRCMTELHRNEKVIPPGCQPPFTSEFVLHGKLKKMRIYPSNIDTCRFEKIIYPKYEKESLIDLIGT